MNSSTTSNPNKSQLPIKGKGVQLEVHCCDHGRAESDLRALKVAHPEAHAALLLNLIQLSRIGIAWRNSSKFEGAKGKSCKGIFRVKYSSKGTYRLYGFYKDGRFYLTHLDKKGGDRQTNEQCKVAKTIRDNNANKA